MKSGMGFLVALTVIVMALIAPGRIVGQVNDRNMNALMSQAQTAIDSKKWQEAIAPLQQLISADPTRWEPFQKLGAVQLNLGHYEDAIRSYEKGIEAAQRSVSNPAAAEAVKAGMAQMLTQEGNAYLKMRKSDEAITAYTRAAEMSPNKSIAYFNLCATLFNTGDMDRAEAACDKAAAVDPTRADAHYVAGSVRFSKGILDPKTKAYRVPQGTAEALKKYLELAPTGPHAKDAKEMLDMIGDKK